jgi:glycosyltransferase involved in cell wall biosynthesis
MMPEISIITICRNEATGIRRTLESLLGQTVSGFEWIVKDGGSIDGTLDILKSHRHRITHLITGPDAGIYDAMNQAARLALGRWLLFLNGGDALAAPDTLAKMQPHLTAPATTVLVGGRLCVWPDGTPSRTKLPPPGRLPLHHFFKRTVNHQSSFIGHPVFKRFGPYDASFRILGDYHFFARAALGGTGFQCVPIIVAQCDMAGISARMKGSQLMNRELRRIRHLFPLTYRLRHLAASGHATLFKLLRGRGVGHT